MIARNELAARFAVASYGDGRPWGGTREDLADAAVKMADALLSALSPPAAVAPAKYEPKVGDVVRFDALHPDYVVTRTAPELGGKFNDCGAWVEWYGGGPRPATYLRPATLAERAACGLPVDPAPEASHSSPGGGTSQVGGAAERDAGIVTPASSTPAPEAKRPGWIKWTASQVNPTVPRKVLSWVDGCPVVGLWRMEAVSEVEKSLPIPAGSWEPCDAPAPTPPAPSREEALAMALREVRRMVEGGVYRATITTYIDATLSRPAATKGGA